MPADLEFISRYFWVMAIAITLLNLPFIWIRTAKYRRENPELARGYAKIIRGMAILLITPWIIMGVGSVFGGAPLVWDFLQPRDGNPFVIAWVLYVAVANLWIAFWLLRRGGAETLAKHPGTAFRQPMSAETTMALMRVWAIIVVPLTFVWLAFVWLVDIPALPTN